MPKIVRAERAEEDARSIPRKVMGWSLRLAHECGQAFGLKGGEVYMFIQEIKTADVCSADILDKMGQLIECVGTDVFPQTLFAISRNVTGCDLVMAFRKPINGGPKLLVSDGINTSDWREGQYLGGHWRSDPIRRIEESARTATVAISRVVAEELSCIDYRNDCFMRGNIASRVSLSLRDRDATTHLNLYFREGRGMQSKAHRFLSASARLLIPLLNRHAATFGQTPVSLSGQAAVMARLKAIEPSMSERELQVCSHIVRGLTSEGIALELQLSVNTVLTYRKRAYARLRISTQNELMKLLYCTA